MLNRVANAALGLVLRGAKQLRRGIWFFTRPNTRGAHAIALTARGTIVLVKLRYARGWGLPGGGVKRSEDPAQAVLRELREEIGMTWHGELRPAAEFNEDVDFKRDLSSIFIVREVEYRPRKWSLEIEEVREAALDQLPPDLSPRSRRWIEAARRYF